MFLIDHSGGSVGYSSLDAGSGGLVEVGVGGAGGGRCGAHRLPAEYRVLEGRNLCLWKFRWKTANAATASAFILGISAPFFFSHPFRC